MFATFQHFLNFVRTKLDQARPNTGRSLRWAGSHIPWYKHFIHIENNIVEIHIMSLYKYT